MSFHTWLPFSLFSSKLMVSLSLTVLSCVSYYLLTRVSTMDDHFADLLWIWIFKRVWEWILSTTSPSFLAWMRGKTNLERKWNFGNEFGNTLTIWENVSLFWHKKTWKCKNISKRNDISFVFFIKSDDKERETRDKRTFLLLLLPVPPMRHLSFLSFTFLSYFTVSFLCWHLLNL